MGDEDDALAVVLELANDAEELLDLLRGEHGGWLVEDEDLGVPEQHLDDLDPLLDADRELLDDGVRIDLEVVLGGDVPHVLAGLADVEDAARPSVGSTPSTTFSATVKTGTSMKCWWTMPMPAAMASPGPVKCYDLAVDEDLAFGGRVEAVDDVHEGGLACTVLTEQAEDLTGPNGEVDVVVGEHTGESLGDSSEL